MWGLVRCLWTPSSQAIGQPLALTRTHGDDSSLDEWLRAEARVLNLDRTPWHMTWVGVRPQRARRKLDVARVSARNLPVELIS